MNKVLRSLSEETLRTVIYAIAVVVSALVAFLIANPGLLRVGTLDVSYAPPFHAFLNGTVAVLLIAGYAAIRQRKITLHRTLMLSAFALSTLFLISYVIYHSQKAEPTYFHGTGLVRVVYLVILVTHIVLAAIIVPLALFTIVRAWRGEVTRHRRIARWTLPLWLYVAVTGVAVYVMLYAWRW
ncbi:MAG: putative membrane protein YozB [Candidatus Kapaibacterium sp.]|nr:MAG: putative membrane protein YozB [Candidatus Kapabacteria bacterium]